MIDANKYKFFDYILEYGIFDEDGNIIGIKENAPLEIKESYEEFKIVYNEALKNGAKL